MDSKKKMFAIAVGVILVIVAAALGIATGAQNKGSVNTIEVPSTQAETSNKSALPLYQSVLSDLVKGEYLDTATQEIVLAAVKKYESDTSNKAVGNDLSLAILVEKKLISSEVADKVAAALNKQGLAKKEEKFRSLVSTGVFKDTAAAETAYNSYIKQLHAKTTELQAAMKKEIEAAQPPMTDADKSKKLTAFNAGQAQRIDEVLAAMVSVNEITKSQADALNAFVTK